MWSTHIRMQCFAILLWYFLAFHYVHGAETDTIFTPPNYTATDQTLLTELKSRIESIPADRRESDGLAILQQYVSRAESDDLKARLLISAGDISKKLGKIDQAKQFFSTAFEQHHQSDMGLCAAESLMSAWQEEFAYDKAATFAADILDRTRLSPSQQIHFTGRLGFFLVASGNPKEGLSTVQGLLKQFPERTTAIAEICESVSITASGLGQVGVYYDGMRWVHDNMPEYGTSARFLGNLAHACQVNKKYDEAMKYYLEIVEKYSQDERVPSYLLELGNICKENGDMLGAYSFYRRLLDKYPDNAATGIIRQIAGNNLISIERTLGLPRDINILFEKTVSESPEMTAPVRSTSGVSTSLNSMKDEPPPKSASSKQGSLPVRESNSSWIIWAIMAVTAMLAIGSVFAIVGLKKRRHQC